MCPIITKVEIKNVFRSIIDLYADVFKQEIVIMLRVSGILSEE